MKIDVILPTFNRRVFLPQAIACIRAQTFSEWRLLVVNDGGEPVDDIVSRFADARIVCFDRPHEGKAAQLNFALAQAEAPYIAYMDDDDEVYPDHLQTLIDAAEKVGADFVYSDTYLTILDPEGRVVRRQVENVEDATRESIRLYNRINHKQVLHTRELASRVGGYDGQMRILIDFDGIKRMMSAARRPFHVRKVTGDHILRMDPVSRKVSSISGLWERDPEAAGRSLLRFFERDPAALARLYRAVPKQEEEIARLKGKLARRLSARLKGLVRHRAGGVGQWRDALPAAGAWREVTPAGGIEGFFDFADEQMPTVAAVNRIAAGKADAKTRRLAFGSNEWGQSGVSADLERIPVDGGLRLRRAGNAPMRWIVLRAKADLPDSFALEFDYVPHSEFKEQLQFVWRMSTLGDRLRFMVRNNRLLAANAVEDGVFAPDGREMPFAFALDRAARVRIESRGGVASFCVDGANLLSLEYDGPAGRKGAGAALIFYEDGASRPIDFELRDFRVWVPA